MDGIVGVEPSATHAPPNMAMRYQHVAADRYAQLAQRMSRLATGQDWSSAPPAKQRRTTNRTRGGVGQAPLPGVTPDCP